MKKQTRAEKMLKKAMKKTWICSECGNKYTPDFKNMGTILSLDEVDEYCEDCNKKAMRGSLEFISNRK